MLYPKSNFSLFHQRRRVEGSRRIAFFFARQAHFSSNLANQCDLKKRMAFQSEQHPETPRSTLYISRRSPVFWPFYAEHRSPDTPHRRTRETQDGRFGPQGRAVDRRRRRPALCSSGTNPSAPQSSNRKAFSDKCCFSPTILARRPSTATAGPPSPPRCPAAPASSAHKGGATRLTPTSARISGQKPRTARYEPPNRSRLTVNRSIVSRHTPREKN